MKGETRATILVANDPQTHATSSIKRNNAKTCRKTCERTGSVDVGPFATTTVPMCMEPPQSSREAGLDRVLLLRNSTLTSCSHSITVSTLAFGDIPSFATGRNAGHRFTCEKNS